MMTGAYVKYGTLNHKEKIYRFSAMRGSSCDVSCSYFSNHINRSGINDGSQTSHHVNQHFENFKFRHPRCVGNLKNGASGRVNTQLK